MTKFIQEVGTVLIVGFLATALAFGIGAAFTFGVAVVARAMKWAPINITVNLSRPEGEG